MCVFPPIMGRLLFAACADFIFSSLARWVCIFTHTSHESSYFVNLICKSLKLTESSPEYWVPGREATGSIVQALVWPGRDQTHNLPISGWTLYHLATELATVCHQPTLTSWREELVTPGTVGLELTEPPLKWCNHHWTYQIHSIRRRLNQTACKWSEKRHGVHAGGWQKWFWSKEAFVLDRWKSVMINKRAVTS